MNRIQLLSAAAALVLVVAPAMAEQNSTPAEQDQTRALNQGDQSGTYASPQTLNGENNPSQEVPGGSNGAGGFAPQQTGKFNPDDFVELKTVDPDKLSGASVEDRSGVAIGHVADVKLARDGSPAEVKIELNDGRHVRVSQASLRFDPKDSIVLTNANLGELNAMAKD
jgi:hypothetical protein